MNLMYLSSGFRETVYVIYFGYQHYSINEAILATLLSKGVFHSSFFPGTVVKTLKQLRQKLQSQKILNRLHYNIWQQIKAIR
jgi:hypothetical protein